MSLHVTALQLQVRVSPAVFQIFPVCRTQNELFFPKHNEKPLEDVHEYGDQNRNVHESCSSFIPRDFF